MHYYKRYLLSIVLLSIFTASASAQSNVWHKGITETDIDVRGNPVTLKKLEVDIPDSGKVEVRFDGLCIPDVGDRITLAASNTPNWGINNEAISIEVPNSDNDSHSFSHTQVYPVSAGVDTFYAVAENYVEREGNGEASVYGSLTVKYFEKKEEGAYVKSVPINKTDLDVRSEEKTVGEINWDIPQSGKVLVHFDGKAISDPGDSIVLAASDTTTWSIDDGNVVVKAYDTDVNVNSFSHSRIYSVDAGMQSFYALAHNYVDQEGSGEASIYGTLTVEYFPDQVGGPILIGEGISETDIDVRGYPVTLSEFNLSTSSEGKALVHFDGVVFSDPGDKIVLAASDTSNWFVNDGNVEAKAINNDLNGNSFSHTRAYNIRSNLREFYAVAENYVDTEGSGKISVYGNFTVQLFPEVATSISQNDIVPQKMELHQNYPNPFNPSTQIRYSIPKTTEVTLEVYSTLGQRVEVLVDKKQSAGTYQVTFEAGNLSSGNYIYRLKAGEFEDIGQMMFLK